MQTSACIERCKCVSIVIMCCPATQFAEKGQSVFYECDRVCYGLCSERELERGDREVWGSVGDNQIGIIHSAALPVKYGYDTVLDNNADNEQVSKQSLCISKCTIHHLCGDGRLCSL